jgi:DUF1680 family protein
MPPPNWARRNRGYSGYMSVNRRSFLKGAGASSLMLSKQRLLHATALHAQAKASEPVRPRSPLAPAAFTPLPLGSIEPAGWLRDQLLIQANGLGGHLDEVWPDVGPDSGWLGGTGESWERGPYFLDGLVPLAWQLRDRESQQKAMRFLDWTLKSSQPTGFFGPPSNNDWWPRMVMLKVLAQYFEATSDPRVIPVMERYFAYSLRELPIRPLRDWGRYRWQDEVLTVLWLYNRNGDKSLLDLARLLQKQGYDWQQQFVNFKYTQRCTPEFLGMTKDSGITDRAMQTHGVNNAMALKASPMAYLLSGSEADRTAIFRQLADLDRYHGLPNGMFSADEHFAGRNPSQGIELCAVVEAMFSLEQAIAITGAVELGDRLEKIAFNALPGTFTDDMWAHQYNQEPNQVEVSLHREPWTTDGPESNIYGLAPNFGCCTANFHQGWPKFTASLWMATADGGLAAIAYAPSKVTTNIAGTAVTIHEETDYPFAGEIRLRLALSSPARFPLQLRIPVWAQGASVRVNARTEPVPAAGQFCRISQTWRTGDELVLKLPMTVRAERGFNESISLMRGPVVFSYPIEQDWVKLADRGRASDWQVYPRSEWNYALAVDETTVAASATVESRPIGNGAFTARGNPVRLTVNGALASEWRAQDGVAGPVPAPGDLKAGAIRPITLIPYGAAKLRITSFPVHRPREPLPVKES